MTVFCPGDRVSASQYKASSPYYDETKRVSGKLVRYGTQSDSYYGDDACIVLLDDGEKATLWSSTLRHEAPKATSSELFVVEGTGDKARFNTWDEVQKYVGDVGEPCVVYRLYAKATPERKVNMEFV